MDKTKATELIKEQLSLLNEMRGVSTGDEVFKKWQRDTGVVIEKVFGNDSKHAKEYKKVSFSPGIFTADKERQYELNKKGFQRGAVSAKAFLTSLLDEIEKFWDSENNKEVPLCPEECILLLFDKFISVSRQLQDRYNNRSTLTIEDEYDVQDLLHALLKLYFDDIRAEEWTPSYAGGSNRMDFLLRNEKTVIEVKKTRPTLKDKEVGEQLIIDIAKYKAHPDCQKLFCFVYDPEGRIGNPASLENDLSGTKDGLEVKVFIRPKF